MGSLDNVSRNAPDFRIFFLEQAHIRGCSARNFRIIMLKEFRFSNWAWNRDDIQVYLWYAYQKRYLCLKWKSLAMLYAFRGSIEAHMELCSDRVPSHQHWWYRCPQVDANISIAFGDGLVINCTRLMSWLMIGTPHFINPHPTPSLHMHVLFQQGRLGVGDLATNHEETSANIQGISMVRASRGPSYHPAGISTSFDPSSTVHENLIESCLSVWVRQCTYTSPVSLLDPTPDRSKRPSWSRDPIDLSRSRKMARGRQGSSVGVTRIQIVRISNCTTFVSPMAWNSFETSSRKVLCMLLIKAPAKLTGFHMGTL